jgi:hypothetical protein
MTWANVSLSTGKVPSRFKQALVIPVYKGKGKKRVEPASYRPVSLLPAASKILELLVKEDLEKYLAAVNGLPPSQFGFRPGRSTVTALAAAHAAWLAASRSGEAVGILAFDLSAAFDTVSTDQLLPKLGALGVNGRALEWFGHYLSGGRQAVVWESSTMFGSNKNNDVDDFSNVRATRSTSNAEITIPLRGLDTFVVHAARVWNSSPELRMAASSASATSIAYKLSDMVIK